MKQALKEWSSTIEALGNGDVIAIWRKGGIGEVFNASQSRFILFPTYTHQDTNKIKTQYYTFLDQKSKIHKDNQVKLKYWAEILDEVDINSLEELLSISDELVNSEEYLKASWSQDSSHNGKVFFLRVYNISDNILITNQPEYGGCKSWIELNIDVPKAGSTAVLSFKEFTQKVRLIKSIIENVRQKPALSV